LIDFSKALGQILGHFLSTAFDARLNFIFDAHSEIGDTQIPILGELRFSDIDPRTSEEMSVLRKPPPRGCFSAVGHKPSGLAHPYSS
jgi:hypothetical protein